MSKFQHDVMLRIVKILNVLMIELPFAACWFLYYSHQTYANLAWEGHFAILGLFFILYIVLGKIYDAFWMSMQRVSELVYGQILGAMATDGILYIVICLMSAKLCNLLPGIAAIVGQLVMAAIWASCAHKWYYKTFPPQKIFFDGQFYDAFAQMKKFIRLAKKELIIIDPYFDDSVLPIIAQKRAGVRVTVVNCPRGAKLLHAVDVNQFNLQYANSLVIKTTDKFHDRFLIIDNASAIHIGASLNYLGKKCFACSTFDPLNIPEMLARLPK